MLITSLDYSSSPAELPLRLARGVMKENIPFFLVKEWNHPKSRIKEVHVLKAWEGKSFGSTCRDLCALVGFQALRLAIPLRCRKTPRHCKPLPLTNPPWACYFAINDSPFFCKDGSLEPHAILRNVCSGNWKKLGFAGRRNRQCR